MHPGPIFFIQKRNQGPQTTECDPSTGCLSRGRGESSPQGRSRQRQSQQRQSTWEGVVWLLETSPQGHLQRWPRCALPSLDIFSIFKWLTYHRFLRPSRLGKGKQGREYCLLAGFFFFFSLFLGGWLGELFLIPACPLGACPVPVGCLLLPALVSGWPGEVRAVVESKAGEG